MKRTRIRTWILLACISAAASGCGGSNHPETVYVSGKITFNGEPCPASGEINFSPIEPAAGFPKKPASAVFTADGKYTATSYSPQDGIVPGRYSVQIVCWKKPPSPDGSPPVSYVSPEFKPAELVIEPGSGSKKLDFDVPLAE